MMIRIATVAAVLSLTMSALPAFAADDTAIASAASAAAAQAAAGAPAPDSTRRVICRSARQIPS